MRVIGTAGHVDHGKSTLVEALTGIHPDRLKEERDREMTIDLGFAWMTLPDGEEIGIVDVPGHRDFIENMLAGVGGIDAALFVVAADEGVMPQTREHLAILDILQIPTGVVALTKIDLIDDPEWLDLIEADLQSVLAHTTLAGAPIRRVSARTRQGLKELVGAIGACLSTRPIRPDLNRPRLPIDRVFTIAGFGSVVTGTLIDGCLKTGDEVEILPSGLRSRVRGLQTHKHKEDIAIAGSRTAVNISGVALDQLRRGDVLAHPGDYTPTRRLDIRFRLLPDASQPIHHNTEVKLFIGASETLARARLLGSEELAPGDEGWLQLELVEPVVAVRGDHYILRRPSPGETLGGGVVVDPHPKGRHKRFAGDALDNLEIIDQGLPSEILHQALLGLVVAPLKEVIARSNLDATTAAQAVAELHTKGLLISLETNTTGQAPSLLQPNDLVTSKTFWDALALRAIQEVQAYHQAYPLRAGIPREELKSRLKNALKASPRLFNALLRRLVNDGALEESGPLAHIPGFAICLTPAQQQSADRLLARFAAAPATPPSVKDCQAETGEELFQALIELGQLTPVSSEVVFRSADYERMLAETRRLLQERGAITAAEARDHFNTSRKYILAFLEHLDSQGITERTGDLRRLRSATGSPSHTL